MKYRGTHVKECPKCHSLNTKTFNSRPTGDYCKRRRKCDDCQARWTSYEISEEEFYEYQKIINSLDEIKALSEGILKAIKK